MNNFPNAERHVSLISNELEFGVVGIDPNKIVETKKLDTDLEANMRDCVELRISLAHDVKELNERLERDVKQLLKIADKEGGSIYGGSSILADVSNVKLKWYRTTALSRTSGQNLLDILGQQITIGVRGEEFGLELYNFLRELAPILLVVTSSSPYKYKDGLLEETHSRSRRISQYEKLITYHPYQILETPHLSSIKEYHDYRYSIAKDIHKRLAAGLYDTNDEELYKIRHDKDGREYTFASFDYMEPYQMYWFVRPRPDFINSESNFVIEIRVPDMPTTIRRMKMTNSFVVGLAYWISENGTKDLPRLASKDLLESLKAAAKEGLSLTIEGKTAKEIVRDLLSYSIKGLLSKNYPEEARLLEDEVNEIISKGNDAEQIIDFVKKNGKNPENLRNHLIDSLKG